jgi:uncharacterized protein with FMN-binding domain
MKKIFLIVFSLILCGCTQNNNEEAQKTYKDGSYTATAQGYGGEFKVTTKIKDDKIIDIVVDEHNETPSLGGVAIEQLITSMKKKNSYDVDVISGATKTSQGMKEAVKKSMENAKKEMK